jgi:mono/diheme cytochrome c family protein
MSRACVLNVLLSFACFAEVACSHSHERERVDFERMRVQQRYGLYGTSGAFADRQSMQPAPAGTVSRESAQDSGVVGSGTSTSGAAMTIPIPVTNELLALGQGKFTIYCAVCHGDGGFGGSLVAVNMGAPRPPSLRTAALRAQPVGYVFGVATRGKGRMPPYAPQLSARERWAVAAYIQRLQASGATTPEQRADSVRAVQIHVIDSTLAAERRR